jgi:hypothetical protein
VIWAIVLLVGILATLVWIAMELTTIRSGLNISLGQIIRSLRSETERAPDDQREAFQMLKKFLDAANSGVIPNLRRDDFVFRRKDRDRMYRAAEDQEQEDRFG